MNSTRLKAYILLLIVSLIWGIAGPVIKITLGKLPWDTFLLYRLAISTLIILPFVKKSHLRIFKSLGTAMLILVYSLANSTLGLGLLFAGTARTSLVSMSLITLFGPILTILAGYYFLKDRITWLEKVGITITFLGSFLIIIEPVFRIGEQQGEIIGNLLIVGSLIAGTVAAVTLKELLRKGISPLFLANLSFVVGFLTIIPISLRLHSLGEIVSQVKSLPLTYHAGVAYMGIFSGTVAYMMANVAQKSIEVSEQAVFGYLFPIISTILAVLILKESVTPLEYFGSGVTLVGIFIAEVKRRTKK